MTVGCLHFRAAAPSSEETTKTSAISPITSAIIASTVRPLFPPRQGPGDDDSATGGPRPREMARRGWIIEPAGPLCVEAYRLPGFPLAPESRRVRLGPLS